MSSGIRVLLAILLAGGISWAQFGSGIQGTILDSTGAVVPGVRILVKNLETGVVRETVSSAAGVYRVPSLSPARYSVTASREGLLTAVQDSVLVEADEIKKVDFTLAVGNTTETVNVSAQPTGVETEEGRLSGRIDSAQLDELPVPDRNVYNLLNLQPGVTGHSLGNDIIGGRTTLLVYANGQNYTTNSFYLDNMSTNSPSVPGGTEMTPNLESIEETRIVTNNFSADQGRNPGAHINVISKSGTNDFHGALWEYFQNNTLTARNFFDVVKVPVYRRNQFGAAFGGPLIRNRTFFFLTYEGTRASGGTTTAATTETPQFRDYIVNKYPNSIAAKLMTEFEPIEYPTFAFKDLGTPEPGVAIGSSSTPLGLPTVGSVEFVDPYTTVAHQFTTRGDHELIPGKDHLYVYYYQSVGTPKAEPIRPEFYRSTTTTGYFGNINHTHIFDPRKLNEFHFAVERYNGVYTIPQHLEIPEVDINGGITGFQNTNNSPGYGTPYYPGGWFPTEFMVKDTFSWIPGRHSFKFGGDLRRLRDNVKHTRNYIPDFTFASILNFAVDAPMEETRTVNPSTGQATFTQNALRSWEGSFFVQDDWKLRRDITINIGARYEYYGAYTDATNRLQNFVPGPPGPAGVFQQIATGSADIVHSSYQANDHFPTIGPRIGFAWDIGSKGKNVVRGGYGLSFDRLSTIPVETTRGNPPVAGTLTVGPLFGTPLTYSLGNPSLPGLGYAVYPAGLNSQNGIIGLRVALSAVNPNFRQPYIHNAFLAYQRALPAGMVIELSGLASAGHDLTNTVDVNRFDGDLLNGGVFHGLNQSFSQISQVNTTANSVYLGGTVSLRKQFSRGLTFQANYTYGKAITEGELNYMDPNNRNLDRGLASYNVPQRIAIQGVWDLPFFRNCSSWACKGIGGWQLSGFGIFEEGLPLNIITSASFPNGDWEADGTTGLARPDAPRTPIQESGFSRQQYLNGIFTASEFPAPPLGTDGTLGRDVFSGPGFEGVDLSMMKNFKVRERINMILRVDAFNAFNRVNLNAPTVDLNSNTFGKSTGANTSRNWEISLKVRF